MKQLLIMLLALVSFDAVAQNLPERGEIRRGNRLFDKEDYEGALESYTQALTFSPASFEANYNLSNTQQRLEQFDKAEETMAKIAADSLLSEGDRADAFYNLGNSQFGQQKYKEALESYKSSMRLNPSDTTAKYNYAYTKKLLEQNQDNEDNQDQNQDQDQNGDDQDSEGDPNEDEQDQDQDGDGDQNEDEQDQGQQPQPQGGGMSEQEQQQILDAIQAQEDKTQEKLDKESGRAVMIPGGKNW
ncbi:MAG: tetratricopeptide repeat protein [Rikenellaceae bacterium]